MSVTYFFYDLETSGLNPRDDRIMQFAGIRTDEKFQPIGKPYNLLVAMSEDTLPSPEALMITGVSPQQTVAEGYTEAEFAKLFVTEICTPDTTILGYNSIRFDDEFIRALLWRNFHDPYVWSWQDGRSRWDMLDVVRMTRALRPDGIKWPEVDGKAVNKLELLSAENGLDHKKAHDALSDVEALIAMTKLVAQTQPQLYDYLYNMRLKNELKQLIDLDRPKPLVYTSGRYDAEFHKTTVVQPLVAADYGNIFVYDLRYDPADWMGLTDDELQEIIDRPYDKRDEDYQPLPVKKLQFNRAPAVAPLGVLDVGDGWSRIGLNRDIVTTHQASLAANSDFANRVARLLLRRPDYPTLPDAENKLYEGFVENKLDIMRCEKVRMATSETLRTMTPEFVDLRLAEMLIPYKARNFPRTLTDAERATYEDYRQKRLSRQSKRFVRELTAILARTNLTDHQKYIAEELKLWYEAIMPDDSDS